MAGMRSRVPDKPVAVSVGEELPRLDYACNGWASPPLWQVATAT